jgi:hypothetical protein
MQEPFPVLTRIFLETYDEGMPILPAKFLGGSAPCLQKITLCRIPYPALPTLLLSTRDLVSLNLYLIPQTGHISPEIMVTSLAALPSLENLTITFPKATSRPDIKPPRLVTRTIIPCLTSFHFDGACEYLDDLIARIDTPQLNQLFIACLDHHLGFQVTQLPKFIDRLAASKPTPFRRADLALYYHKVVFNLHCQANFPGHQPFGTITWFPISSRSLDWHLSDVSHELSQFSATFSAIVHLELELHEPYQSDEEDDVEWLHLLHQFTALKVLRVSRELAGPVAIVLEAITAEMVAEVLPSLDLVYLVDQPPSSVEKFVASRRFTDHPVTVVNSKTEFDQRIESYCW